MRSIPFRACELLSSSLGSPAQNLRITRHTVHMKNILHTAGQVLILLVILCLGVGMVAFPLVFSDAVIANLIRLIEIISRVT